MLLFIGHYFWESRSGNVPINFHGVPFTVEAKHVHACTYGECYHSSQTGHVDPQSKVCENALLVSF